MISPLVVVIGGVPLIAVFNPADSSERPGGLCQLQRRMLRNARGPVGLQRDSQIYEDTDRGQAWHR